MQGNGNNLDVYQHGNEHRVKGRMIGHGNDVDIIQKKDVLNKVELDLLGSYNKVDINQTGVRTGNYWDAGNNKAWVTVRGNGHDATIMQTGNNNASTVTQKSW